MKEQIYLGVDLGAESGRVMTGFWNGKRIRLQELHRFPNGPVEINGSLRWDVLRLWSEIQQGLVLAGRKCAGQIQSIGVDSWGVDYVLLSKSGQILCQPYHYRDAGTRGMMQAAFRRVSRANIFAATGLQFMELNTLYQLLALKKRSPEILNSADCLLMMPDFFHWCLCGRRVAEFTDATTTQFFDPIKRDWALGLLQRFELPTRMLPEVVTPGSRIGPLTETVARSAGLPRIPVVAPASHDTGSAVAAVPALPGEEGSWAYISSGTWSLMGLELSKANVSQPVLELNLTNEGGVDGTYRLLKNITGLWLIHQCKRAFERNGSTRHYAELIRLAEKALPLKSIIDPDDPRFGKPCDMPRAIQEFCRETKQPVPGSEGAIIRCALESLALRYQAVLGSLEAVTGKPVRIIHIVGGGSRNRLLNQFAADACNRPVVAGPVEATVLGNVLVQARAASELSSLSELREVVRKSSDLRNLEPRANQISRWQEARARFMALRSR